MSLENIERAIGALFFTQNNHPVDSNDNLCNILLLKK